MSVVQVMLRLPSEMVDRIDAAAGRGRRNKWAADVFEAALGGGGVGAFVAASAVAENEIIADLPMRASGSDRLVVNRPVNKLPPVSARRVAPAAPERVEGEPAFRRPDDGVLWRSLRGKRGGAREMRDRLGWMEMRVERAVSSLLASGLVRTVEGLMEAVHPSEGS